MSAPLPGLIVLGIRSLLNAPDPDASPPGWIEGFYAAAPQRSSTMLGSLRTWMGKHNRTITVAICFVFGAFFLVRGLLGA